jgi:polyhydroxyalkanoate synthesis regulator phasin
MKTRTAATLSVILTLGALPTVAATTQHSDPAKKPAMQNKMGMSHEHMKMASEPHHVLAMAYHQNLAAFAKALHEQTTPAGPLNLDFARAAVSEMRRSFDQMKQHHQEHMKGMSTEMHAKMSGMMEKMGTHQAEMNTQLTDLEQELLSATPDAKKVSTLADRVHKHLVEMAKMHEGC